MDAPYTILTLSNMEFYAFSDVCDTIRKKLSDMIDQTMRLIFRGHIPNEEQWECVIKAMNQAVFLRDQLDMYRANILAISEDLLVQFEEWLKTLQLPAHN